MAAVTRPTRRAPRTRIGLTARVAAFTVVLLAAWFLAYSLLIAPRVRESFEREQEARIELLARATGNELDHLLDSAAREIENVAALPALASMDADRIDEVLAHEDATTPTFLHFFVLDATGHIVSRPSKPGRRGADRSTLPYFVRVRDEGRTIVGEVRLSTAGNRSLLISTPIHRPDGGFAGVLAGSIGLMDRNKHIYKLISDPTSTRWPAEVFLITARGEVLASSAPRQREHEDDSLGIAAAPAGSSRDSNTAFTVTDSGVRWIASSFGLERVDWRMFVRVPASVIDERAAAITRTITIASLTLCVAVLAISLVFTGWLVGPLNRLSTRLTTYGREGAAPPIPLTGPRELQDAAAAFNAMLDERERARGEREALEHQLRQSQKLQMVGTLASGIAHDFNNLLTPIVFGASLLDRRLPADSPLRPSVDNIQESAARATELIERILTFSRSSTHAAKHTHVDAVHVVREALRLAKVSVPATIALESHLAPDAGSVNADAAQLHQVILNLCKNAADAISPGTGTVTVDLRRGPDDDTLVLTISDTGSGMDADTLARVFEPFFTTKATGKGTGLGMSVVHGIIADHEGRIEIETELGKGTSVRISLPRVEPTPTPAPAPPANEVCPARVLLVDDEARILRVASAALTDLGYQVVTEQDAPRALARLVDEREPFDLVVCDNNMPTLTGCDLIERAAAVRSELPFVVITGVVGQALRDRCDELGVIAVLEKPLTLERLEQAVRAALARRA